MTIIKENGKIKVSSDYNPTFIAKAKGLHGKWEKPYWVFEEEDEKELKGILLEAYGECGSLSDVQESTVTVLIDLDKYKYGDAVKLGNRVLVSRPFRDHMVKMATNVTVISGEFCPSGGSAKYPAVTHEEGTVIRVRQVPLRLYEASQDMAGVSLDDSESSYIGSLLSERETLLRRLEEINKILEDDKNGNQQ